MNTLIGLMPSDIVRPFMEGDTMQLVVMAVFIVCALKAGTIRKFLDEGNEVLMKITEGLMRFIPLVVFSSIALLLLTAARLFQTA